MGNTSRPGSVVIEQINHAPFEVAGERYFVQELVWNGISGRSYELVNSHEEILTEDESFDDHPTDAQIATVLEGLGIDCGMETCKFCREAVLPARAYRHDNGWVGSCCWDERLRMTA
ncbi:hypothetical protein SMD44_p10046 (plasmid) [Streptomyces alboflavus]|uniref:Uncharacterized protein n=1 Tax=Streptomyces alboflavus TaxID=67267 RepID=A0A291W343_9ACTN|nr:hypothetical protein [Streptomyces alboflavus]ATM24545.1 hypothetical protein SMD44_p10046 [Streptomyces alboflavus]